MRNYADFKDRGNTYDPAPKKTKDISKKHLRIPKKMLPLHHRIGQSSRPAETKNFAIMKAFANIHKIENFENRSNVTFNIGGPHNDFVDIFNKIAAIERKHNAQSNVYSNKSSLLFDKKGNVIALTDGNSGGTITFHSHSCDHKAAAAELESLLKSI